ncbi:MULTISPECIES: hypothetical protein [Pseudomonas]|uniref:hypothetical protein n=1 Tax=Pseudomonas TaxID=286 RepID=UPI000D701918|nr:hypothetical protein [Pseudomonas sp. RW407]PWU29150.1 hypothetical protein DK254_13390 [Pseudomonas sp. RW407]
MGLTTAQLDELGRSLDANHRELLFLTVEQANQLARDHATSHLPPVGAPGLCQANGPFDGSGAYLDSPFHSFASTPWGVPVALGSFDTVNFVRLVRDLGGLNTRIRYTFYQGRQYVVLSGYPGLRRILTGTRYSVDNAKLVQMGVGRYGIRGSSLSGFRLSCYVAVGLEVLEWYFNDQLSMLDLLGGVGIELVKAGIASAVGYAVATGISVMFGFAVLPVLVGALVVFGVGVGLNLLDQRYGIKQRVRDSLHFAVDNASSLTARFEALDVNNVRTYAERAVGEVIDAAVDQAVDEARNWLLKRVPPGLVPEVPFRTRILENLKLPKL